MYDPNVCTPTMFEDELRALASMPAFADPDIDARLDAVGQLKRGIEAVREIPGWGGDSVGEAQDLLERMEKGALEIERALRGMKADLRAASDIAAGAAREALRRLPSASAEGFLADAGRTLSGVTDGWGALDTGEAVAREEARLAAERETAAMNELKNIRGTLAAEARQDFTDPGRVQVNPSSVPLPSIDVEAIDARVPAVGSNAPSSSGGAPSAGGSGGYPQGGAGIDSGNPPTGTWVAGGDGNGRGDGVGNGDGNGDGDGNGSGNGDGVRDGTRNDGPNVDSPGGGILPGYPGGLGGVGGAGGGLLPGGGSSGLGAAIVGGAGAAAMLGARSASLNAPGGAGLFSGGGSGAGAGAATAGRGLLGMSGATVPAGMGMTGPASGSASGAVAGSTAGTGGRSMSPGMMGTGVGDDEKRERSGLSGPIAPKLEDDEEVGPRSRSAQAGSRSALD